MVVGNGLLAKAFLDYKSDSSVLVFASGVSNSLETDQKEYQREFNLLQQSISSYPKAKLIYFSTLSILDESINTSMYIQHKIEIENYIKKNVETYVVFRVSNVVGQKGNKNTLMNFLVTSIKAEDSFKLWQHAERNFIDVSDLEFLSKAIVDSGISNRIVNIGSRQNINVVRLVHLIENYLNIKARYSIENKGEKLSFPLDDIDEYLTIVEKNKGAGDEYINYLLQTYYNE